MGEYNLSSQSLELAERLEADHPRLKSLRVQLEVLQRLAASPAEADRFAATLDSEIRDLQSGVSLREYYRALIAMEAGGIVSNQKLRQFRKKREADFRRRAARAAFLIEHSSEIARRNDLKKLIPIYDPRTRTGNPDWALLAVNSYLRDPPYGLNASFRSYRAQLLEALGRKREPAQERGKAKRLQTILGKFSLCHSVVRQAG